MAGSEARDAWPKPLDVGNGRVGASFAPDGSWLSVGCPHPTHGFVELNGAPAFDEALRGRPDAVRRYRHRLTLAGDAALRLTGAVPELAPDPGPAGRHPPARLAGRARPPAPPGGAGRLGPAPAAGVRRDHRGESAAPAAAGGLGHRPGDRPAAPRPRPPGGGPAGRGRGRRVGRGMAAGGRRGPAAHRLGPAARADPGAHRDLHAGPGRPAGARRPGSPRSTRGPPRRSPGPPRSTRGPPRRSP